MATQKLRVILYGDPRSEDTQKIERRLAEENLTHLLIPTSGIVPEITVGIRRWELYGHKEDELSSCIKYLKEEYSSDK
ncbi:hypothetical protein GOV03_03515 [Candidatus Woesearchaeota archaeon]|nr:hypothetical protein [Candidatus Woesearchaeota archaeon]